MLKISNLRYEILRDVIISDFSLRLRAGEVKTLFGPSGCGKTSLLRLVCGLEDKKAGRSKTALRKSAFCFKKTACCRTSRHLKISKFLALRA